MGFYFYAKKFPEWKIEKRVKNIFINEKNRDKMNLEYGKPEGHTLSKDGGDWFEPSKMVGMKKGKLLASLFFFRTHDKHVY